MTQKITWESQYYSSTENCALILNEHGGEARAEITGIFNNKTYQVGYTVKTDANWLATCVDIKSVINGDVTTMALLRDTNGKWVINGSYNIQFDDCSDIDISLSPFTNTLPINRLKLKIGDRQKISVLYIDVLEQRLKKVEQLYSRISGNIYKFENVPNDFEAEITVDEFGLVIDYPGLFVRTG